MVLFSVVQRAYDSVDLSNKATKLIYYGMALKIVKLFFNLYLIQKERYHYTDLL